ncbi:PAP/OAS1 substrate-binding domain superfamily [Forsythia ovata]|uniref:PAP/OAS1 substrate-binding domain superfamily n=1 Tax=Forsythia ovata TaxID=205694 RepID=A0ABD1RN21_9LAMI
MDKVKIGKIRGVCTFGSIPLKTYLPDGDIDLTAFSHEQNLKDTWASQVCDMLENEEKNDSAEFHVKEVQYIQAEVKIIKCLVENIVMTYLLIRLVVYVRCASSMRFNLKYFTAEPPQKDSGEFLLSKLFLDACSSVYAVFPGGHENNGQPFVSKHFNVIDPLRVNNNLGRSVSKGT